MIKFKGQVNEYIEYGLGLLALAIVLKVGLVIGLIGALAVAGSLLLGYGFVMNATFTGNKDGRD
jgi:hypothetical protein